MGLAYGSLMYNEINDVLPQVEGYMKKKIGKIIHDLPEEIREAILVRLLTLSTILLSRFSLLCQDSTFLQNHGINWALELTYNVTLPYTPPHFLEMMRGVAMGAALPYMVCILYPRTLIPFCSLQFISIVQDIVRVAMIPELIKASCSILGAWGKATTNTPHSGSLIQLRALDWSLDGMWHL